MLPFWPVLALAGLLLAAVAVVVSRATRRL